MRTMRRPKAPLLAFELLTTLLLASEGLPCASQAAPRLGFLPALQSLTLHERSRDQVMAGTMGKRLVERCTENYRNATLDHFSWVAGPHGRTAFKQRYFTCDEHARDGGPIFFYAGNEADVTLYLEATGLMWELAPQFGALLVFAEHRYYGASLPFARRTRAHMQFLTSEQAMADYAELLMELKQGQQGLKDSAVIVFGGSYGGMLAAWMRLKYAHVVDGAIAASAPVLAFYGEDPPYDAGSFAKIVARDASEDGGSAAACADNVRRAWSTLRDAASSRRGRRDIAASFALCKNVPLKSTKHVEQLIGWAASAWDYMAMGNYPYRSSYILNGDGSLPPYPLRAACEYLADPDLSGIKLLAALKDAVAVFYNYTSKLDCCDYREGVNPASQQTSDFWDYQWCTEQFMPFSKDGVSDMFWSEPFDADAAAQACEARWRVQPRASWPRVQWGGRHIRAASNIVFSNGLLDPWSGGGVLSNISDSIVAIVIPEGAHHLDLMFSHPDDPASVIQARDMERAFIAQWIDEAAANNARAQRDWRVVLDAGAAT